MTNSKRMFEKLSMSTPFDANVLKMRSPTNGELTLEEICDKINEFVTKEIDNGHKDITIAIGTDSQAFKSTKVVAVIAVHSQGNGGIYFYETFRFPKMSIHDKILNETVLSINLASTITPILDRKQVLEKVNFQIHCDIGNNGKTNKYINEITGMVKACEYDCVIKPDSFAASGIANKYSK